MRAQGGIKVAGHTLRKVTVVVNTASVTYLNGKTSVTRASNSVRTVTSAYAPGDATHSIEITPTPASFGWGFLRQSHTGVTDNLSAYASTGTLKFWISTTYPGKIEIGIGTDTVDREAQEAYLQIQPGNYGYCNTGAWCQVSIPLKDFAAKNPNIDLALVLGRFVIADRYAFTGKADNSNIRNKLYIDGINWSK